MRHVYQPPRFHRDWPTAILLGVLLTLGVFVVLPFTTAISASRSRQLMLTRADVAAPAPPEAEEEPPPPPEEPKEEEPEAPPELADNPMDIPLSADLDVAVGSGGALAGFGDLRAATSAVATGDDTFGGADLEQRPQPTSQVPPAYPTELRKARLEGMVIVDFVVDESGRVEEARVDRSSHPEFERPALEAIRRWRFRPGMREGKPVRSYNRQTFRFRPPA